MSKPLVTICLITYNHGKYIAQALDSIFQQDVDFQWELNIADDCSTDDTRSIISDYYAKYPTIINLIFQQKNVGPAKNWRDLLLSANGKYIAYIEGDDYWADKTKLKKQINFLENNSDFSICFHDVKSIDLENQDCGDIYALSEMPIVTSVEDLARRNYIPSPSVVVRNLPIIRNLPPWFDEIPMGDWPFYLIIAEFGKIGFIKEKLAVYRIHSSGSWSGSSFITNNQKNIKARGLLDKYFGFRYHSHFFNLEDFYNNEKLVMNYYLEIRNLNGYFNSVFKLIPFRRSLKKTWGYYLLLVRRYFLT